MTLTIDISPAVEQALEKRAQESGQTVTDFAASILSQVARLSPAIAAPEKQAEIAARLAALERFGSYDTRIKAGLPPLSDADVSRESIYEGRGQ
jgi:hypothetical protein